MPRLPDRPKPSPFRRVERVMMGFVMGIMAFFIEKMVMRSLKRSGSKTPVAGSTPIKGSGRDIEHQA
jgi:hypothetical protein